MKDFPTDPMQQHSLFIAALCDDWREAGRITRDTPRANAVLGLAKQIHREARAAEKAAGNNHG